MSLIQIEFKRKTITFCLISLHTHSCRIDACYTNSLYFCFGILMQITSTNTLRVAFKLFYNARRYHSTSFCNTDNGERMAKMEAMCFLLHFETPIRQLASLSIMYTFLCVYFQQGNLEIQRTDFLVQALRENQNANKHKLKIQKCFLLFSNQCNRSSFIYFGDDCFIILIRVVIFESWSGLCYSVMLGSYTQLCLGHILGCAWIIIHLLGAFWDAAQMIFKKNFFSIFPKRKNVFTSVRIRWWQCWPHT